MAHDRDSRSGSEKRSRSRSRTRNRDRSWSRSSGRERRSRSGRHERSRSRNRERRHSRRSRSRSEDHEMDTLKLCWRPIKENPGDFDAWTRLLQCVEQLDETKAAREAYDEFLKRYPYCYGYWRKYAELERRHKHYDRSLEVYERGVRAIELSVDLWLHYLSFVREVAQSQEGAANKTRMIYDRAIEACGMEFRSDKLWEEYIAWELNNGETLHVGALYDRLLSTPTLLYSNHFDKYQTFVNSYEPDRVIAEDEYNEIFAKVETELKKTMDGDLYLEEEFIDDTPPDFIPENGEEPPRKLIKRRKHCEEALRAMRQEILERRRKKHLLNEQEVSRRWAFEESIKRPYFHVKPLERAQLRNWRAYLDYEIERGDPNRIVILFERCLIACAMYEEMWIKYARYMNEIGEVERARDIYRRASGTHLPRKPNIHLAYSAFEEEHGDFETANAILAEFNRKHPGYAIIPLRRVGIERRMLTLNTAHGATPDYSSVISHFERLIQDPQTPRRLATFYALKLARFHAKTRNDRKLAEKILLDALTRDKDSEQLYLALIDLAYSAPVFDENAVLDALDSALNCEYLSNEEKLRFSQRKLDFLEDLGTDINKLQKHLEYHTQLQKTIEGIATSSKRKSDHESRGNHSEKRSHTNSSYGVPYVQQQQQYYIAATTTTDAYAAAAAAQQSAADITTTYYYTTQPTASTIQLQQTY
uniref:Pre-mRNA-processing factor 39 n=1 Tax=Parascaris univalens TaxID=6257 RepID=A0A915AYC5_PARUN